MRSPKMKRGRSSGDRLSKFFKVYLPEESGYDLELPTSFNSCLPKSLPRTVTVRSIYGKIWKMALRKSDGDAHVLVNGWKRILKDQDLNGGDFLAFEFDNVSKCFDFCVYEGRTMCKKVRQLSDEINEESYGKEEASDDNVIDLDDDDDVIALDDDDSDDVDYDYSDDNDAGNDYADDDNNSDDAAFEDDVEADDHDNDDDEEDYRVYLDDRNNPFFPVTIKPKKKSQLQIPARVIRDYGLNFPASITVIDPLTKKFGTLQKEIKIQRNGSVFIKGFGSIIRRNQVELTDKIICELKKTGNNLVHTIKIYVING